MVASSRTILVTTFSQAKSWFLVVFKLSEAALLKAKSFQRAAATQLQLLHQQLMKQLHQLLLQTHKLMPNQFAV
jgi:hypothetical protein